MQIINSAILNLFFFNVFGSCFRTLAVNHVSDYYYYFFTKQSTKQSMSRTPVEEMSLNISLYCWLAGFDVT